MQRPPPRSRGGASRIPRPQGSLGDLRNPSLGHGELARSHDSGISRSASLVSLASMAASRTAVTRRRAVSRPDVLDEGSGRGVAACFDRSSSRGECTAEEHFLVHLECRHALEVAKSKIENLEREIVKQQLEINRLRVESIATSFREPSPATPGPVDAELDFELVTAAAPTKAKAVSDDEEDAGEADDSILEFWKALHVPEKQKAFSQEQKGHATTGNMVLPRSSSTPRNSMKSSCSETWTLDKSHNLLSNSTCSSSKSMENLRSLQRHGTTLVEHQPRKARSLHNSAVSQFQWKQCTNRPSKLDLAKHTEDAGIVRRLESPAAISLLSPRPFNRQNSGSSQVRMVPPLDFSSLNSLSSSSQSYEYMAPVPPPQQHHNHFLLQNAQSNLFESNQLLKNLRKYFPQK